MDCGVEYIKMCEKAVEIQKQSPFNPFDEVECDTDQYGSFYRLQGDRIEVLHWDNDEGGDIVGGYKETYLGLVWLPRQDQLQILSGLSWKEFDKECLKYDAETKERAGIQVVIRILDKTAQ